MFYADYGPQDLRSRAGFVITQPVQLYRDPCGDGAVLGLVTLCSCHPERLNTFWTRSPASSLVIGPMS